MGRSDRSGTLTSTALQELKLPEKIGTSPTVKRSHGYTIGGSFQRMDAIERAMTVAAQRGAEHPDGGDLVEALLNPPRSTLAWRILRGMGASESGTGERADEVDGWGLQPIVGAIMALAWVSDRPPSDDSMLLAALIVAPDMFDVESHQIDNAIAALARSAGIQPPSPKPGLVVEPPFFIITGSAPCWSCGLIQHPIGLVVSSVADTGVDETSPAPSYLQYVTELPEQVLGLLEEAHPPYKMHRSQTAGFEYYTCFCECGSNYGDKHLFGLGEVFSPLTEQRAAAVSIVRLPLSESFAVRADYGECTSALLDHIGKVT